VERPHSGPKLRDPVSTCFA